jgi:hypothetical protein
MGRVSKEKADDLAFGDAEEQKVLPVLKDYFQRNNIQRNPDRMGKYDFYCDIDADTIETWELKSRKYYSTNPKIRAEGCIINTDKFKFNTYILVNFIDGLYCYTVRDKEALAFPRQNGYVRDREGGCASNEVSYIPFTVLKLIHSWPRKCLISLAD